MDRVNILNSDQFLYNHRKNQTIKYYNYKYYNNSFFFFLKFKLFN